MPTYLTAVAQAAPALAALAVLALLVGGVVQLAKHRNRTKGILMLVLALVIAGNLYLWTLPPIGR